MIPLFTSQYSGKSILTYDLPDSAKKNNKQSILTICQDNNIVDPFIVENSLTGFMEMYKNCQEIGINPRFGWRANYNSGAEDEVNQKIVIFIKNTDGYKDLIKLHNNANKSRKPINENLLREFWTDNLILVIPFYDSYIYNNAMKDTVCMPPPQEFISSYFVENNGLPFDPCVANLIPKEKNQLAKTILYTNRQDFNIWLTYRCALNLLNKGKRRSLENPMFDLCSSDEFCWESYLEATNR